MAKMVGTHSPTLPIRKLRLVTRCCRISSAEMEPASLLQYADNKAEFPRVVAGVNGSEVSFILV